MRTIEWNLNKNKSMTYILPLLADEIGLLFRSQILNSYIRFSEEDEKFCILYGWSSDPDFLNYEDKLFKNNLFLFHRDYNDKVAYMFSLPQDILDSVHKLINGRAQDISESHKKKILAYWEKKSPGSIPQLKKVFDGSLSTVIDMSMETLQKNVKIIHHTSNTFQYEGK